MIGGTRTGEEFIKKVEEGLNENSASNLEAQYVAGNRNMDFLMKYIEALVKARDVEKAKGIAREVLVSLDDEEKCSEPYWFIYENRELSPVGSGNMVYLLKHVEKFRQGVGVEKVDAAVAGLFEMQLEDILRGRNPECNSCRRGGCREIIGVLPLDGTGTFERVYCLDKGGNG